MVALPPLPAITGGPSGPAISGGNPLFSGRNAINVAPVGVNLGSILKNFEGSPANGGDGLDVMARYVSPGTIARPVVAEGFPPVNTLVCFAILAGAGFLVFRLAKG